MTNYSTGDLAKLCGVTVRTVQYYDDRGILSPSGLTEGGRRLYTEDDLKRLRFICFLRELGLPLKTIGELLARDGDSSAVELLLFQQKQMLQEEVEKQQEKLGKVESLLRELKQGERARSPENAQDWSWEKSVNREVIVPDKKGLAKIHRALVLIGIPMDILQITAIVLWIVQGAWWYFALWIALLVPFSLVFFQYYYVRVDYICPRCHQLFKPARKEAFFADHTPSTRKLTCTCCGHHGFCVETCKRTKD